MQATLLRVILLSAVSCLGCSKPQSLSSHEAAPAPVPSPNPVPTLTEEQIPGADCWQRIPGGIGSSSQFDSGWLDLTPMSDFRRGTRIRLLVGGTAKKAVVRLLPQGDSPDSPSGIIDAFDIPEGRTVTITLDADYVKIVQISVHGGPYPWRMFPLGGGNGPAYLTKVERSCP